MQARKRHNELNFTEESMVFNVTQPLSLYSYKNCKIHKLMQREREN